jgi:hypothetical protein
MTGLAGGRIGVADWAVPVVRVALAMFTPALVLWLVASNALPRAYRGHLLAIYTTFAAFFCLKFAQEASISDEPRHFLPAAVVLAPGLAHTLLRLRPRVVQLAAWGAVGLLLLASSSIFALHRFKVSSERMAVGPVYFQSAEAVATATWLAGLDRRENPDQRLFVFHPFDRSLEAQIVNSRLVPSGAPGTGIPAFRDEAYFFSGGPAFRGRDPDVYLVTQTGSWVDEEPLLAGRLPQTIRQGFPDYPEPELVYQEGRYLVFRFAGTSAGAGDSAGTSDGS